MSNVIRLSDKKRIREHARERAGEYLARINAGVTPEDEQQIQQWLCESPIHREVFLEMAALWDELTVLSSLSEVFPLENYAPPRRSIPLWSGRGWAAACAVLLLAISSWFLLGELRQRADGLPDSDALVYQHHATAIGEQATLTLPDASEVILNTNTEIEVVYTDSARNIFLKQGEGFFSVSKDPSRPFRVYAGKRMVEAVGTEFTVQHTDPESVEVVVKEGRVNFLRLSGIMAPQTLPSNVDEVLYRSESVSLVAGDQAAAATNTANSVEKKRIQQEEIDVKLAWTHGMLLFQGMTLENVLKEVSRYTTTRIDSSFAISQTKVTGYYQAGDIDGLLVAMKNNFHIEAKELGKDHILLHAED